MIPDKLRNADTVFIYQKIEFPIQFLISEHIAPQNKLNTLRRFFVLFGADPLDLVFFLKDTDEPKSIENTPERYELRKRYWAFALPYIREKFGETGPFSNVNPSTSNWISGFFGIGGFNITCVSNFDCARVQLYLGKSDKDKNKAVFDYIYQHKAEIEEKLGGSLIWDILVNCNSLCADICFDRKHGSPVYRRGCIARISDSRDRSVCEE